MEYREKLLRGADPTSYLRRGSIMSRLRAAESGDMVVYLIREAPVGSISGEGRLECGEIGLRDADQISYPSRGSLMVRLQTAEPGDVLVYLIREAPVGSNSAH